MQLNSRQIIAALSSLSAQELHEVATWCEALGASAIVPADDPYAEHAFSALAKCLSEFYNAPQPPTFRLFLRGQKRQEKAALLDGIEHLKRCVLMWWPDARREVHFAIVRYLCRLVFDECARKHPRPRWRHLSDGLCRLEEMVELAFPGWLRSGAFQRRVLSRFDTRRAA